MADLGLTTSTTLEALLQSEVGASAEYISGHINITMPADANDNSADDQATPRAFEQRPSQPSDVQPLTSQEALQRLHDDIHAEIVIMNQNFNSRPLVSWLLESISFRSELSKMRWPGVVFMTAQAVAHFVVAFVLKVENLATHWVGFQGFILTALLAINLSVNLWDTKLRFKELMMKAEQIRLLVKRCANDRHLLRRWKHFSWKSANARNLFIPKSPCVHQTITYRDDSCLNLPDFLLVRGDIIHLFPGERAPSDCVSLNTMSRKQALLHEQSKGNTNDGQISLKEGDIFHMFTTSKRRRLEKLAGEHEDEAIPTADMSSRLHLNTDSYLRAHSKLRRARKGMDFLVTSTPYRKSLRISLQQSHKRPVNSIEKECFIVSRKYFETYVIPMVFVLSTVVTAIHYGYLDLTDSDQEIKTISIAYLLLRPSLTIMPFLPWMFPCFWMAVNAYGSARLLCCAETQRCRGSNKSKQGTSKSKQGTSDWFVDQSPGWNGARRISANPDQYKSTAHFENLLATPNAAGGGSDQNRHDDELRDLQSNIKFTQIFRVFLDLINGRGGHVWRSSSLLQVLGCMTSLCCIDKNGILSWPNPTPEKVFVVAENQDLPRQHRLVSNAERPSQASAAPHSQSLRSARNGINTRTFDASSSNSADMLGSHPALAARHSLPESHNLDNDQVSAEYHFHHRHPASSVAHPQGRAEVLDISLAFSSYRAGNEPTSSSQSTRLQFDDPHWSKFLSNLKPLGLSILLNNCCERSFGDYFRFMRHISYESILRCNLSPVVKRRCICDLARLIGFSRDSIKKYRYINQVGAYKLADPIKMSQGKLLVSSLENSKRLKLPFPNLVCNIHQDTITGGYQVFSQGTADLVLDACVEYWNGKQLVTLDEATRKKIMDFYHRTSLTSYCSAFAYSPLLKSHDLHENYIEMPADGSKYSCQMRQATNELHEEFFRSQVMSVHPPIRSMNKSEGSRKSDPKVRSESNHARDTSEFSDSLVASSPSSPALQTHQPYDSCNYSLHQTQKIRQHLSAEDILAGACRERTTRPRADEADATASRRAMKRRKLADALDELSDQVFVGMVSMQYQACPDFVMLVEQLEHACIRFVHFSKENELRSRVFSEKMGLESGWNCHVSLQSDRALDEADKKGASVPSLQNRQPRSDAGPDGQQIELKPFYPSSRISDILNGTGATLNKSCDQIGLVDATPEGSNKRNSSNASDDGTLHSWRSLPSLVMQIVTRVSSLANRQQTGKCGGQRNLLHVNCGAQMDSQSDKDHNIGSTSDEEESTNKDEAFDTLAFDMSNRAKLPKGIENIRPHLETIDNIPLQVSLFTDCTTELTKEMIEIMQDYGEIVCVIGSSSSRFNTPIFLQANASIGIEPLVPKSCTQNKPRGLAGHKVARKRAAGPSAATVNLKRSQPDSKSKREGRPREPRQAISDEARQQHSTLLKVNNPRDRLGIGPTIFSGHGEQANQANGKRHSAPREAQTNLIHTSSSPSSSSSSSPSSSSSSSSSQSPSPRRLSQSLSESNSSSPPSDDEDSSSSCHSVDGPCGQRRHRARQHAHHESHDGDDDETMDEEEFASADQHLGNPSGSLASELPEPSSLAGKLASLPCSYNYNRREQVHLYGLIMEARHFTFKMKNTFVCMICFALSISSAQFLASLLFLPPMLSSGLTIWLTVVVVPLMSFSLMSTTMDSQVMKIAVGKNLQLKPENITFFVICYLIKFIPSIIVVVLSFGFIIAHSCKLTGFGSSSLGPCWMFTYVRHTHNNSTGAKDEPGEEDLLWSSHLLTAQVSAAFLMVLYFVVISSGFVHRSHLMWQRSPTRNRLWVIISLVLIVGQLLYNRLVLELNLGPSKVPYEFLASLPLHIWLISLVWPILVIGVNLAVKRAEIKATIRQQRRARFDFNTKLGMNSPF